MTKAARWVEIGVGVFFLVSAAAKAFDMETFGAQVSAYNVVKDAALVRGTAYVALAVETLLGALLVAGIRYAGLTHLVSSGMILVYSTLVVYAWRFHGLEDCGCLGAWIALGPVETLIKNAALLALLGFAWFAGGATKLAAAEPRPQRNVARPIAAAAMSAVLALAAYDLVTAPPAPAPDTSIDDPARPYARFVFEADGESFNLGEGRHLVALLNATCKHCQASVPGLNELFAEDAMPDMVALMMGTPAELEEFRATTSPLFAMHGIDTPTFMELLGSAPPRLAYVMDGKPEQVWDWHGEMPTAEIRAYFAASGE
jgi:hypothetical protein